MEGLSPPSKAESFLSGNYRLACQASIADSGADVEFAPLRRQPRILTHSVHRDIDPDPLTVREGDSVLFNGRQTGRYQGSIYGLAIDVGTTTVAMNLVDLESGATIHTASFENPQKFGGSDVMNRIAYDGGPNRGELRQVMLSAINFEIGEMARSLGFHRRRIYEVVVVANSTMRDLLFGLDVQSIGERPYQSSTEIELHQGKRATTALNVRAGDLDLRVHPDANVYGGPLIGCHVGADVAADLLAVGMDQTDDVVMLVDVGTNTEVVIGNRHRMMAASCPAGPAFEGGQITFGMPSYDGAVESVELVNGRADCRTIGGVEPRGICGADISALAQAKSANYSGQYIVLRNYGAPLEEISQLYLAGAFANHINVDNAMQIGFIADFPPGKITKMGNASLEGATLMLISGKMRQTAEELVRRVEHVELESTPDFFDIFVEGCMFNPMARTFESPNEG